VVAPVHDGPEVRDAIIESKSGRQAAGVRVRGVDVAEVQRQLAQQGAWLPEAGRLSPPRA
jgi:hypothetical protein